MKRILVSFIAVMLGVVGFSQSVIIHFKDGSFEKHKMSLIESIEFVEDDYDTSASIYLEKAGTLSSKLSKSQASELLKLKLSGHMDARDFDYIKWDCMKIEEVDLSDVVIDSYSGSDGTNEGYDASYGANEIPLGAFFYWVNSYKYNYAGRPSDEGMPSLKKIILPQGIKAIRRNAFARAYNLTEINIPDGVESIDYVAFAICTSLEEIKLPVSLKTIGKQAFADMKSMKRFYVAATTPPTAYSNSFQGIPSDAVLYVPSGTENKYRNAIGWNTFTNIVGVGDTPSDNTNDEDGWQMITDDFDKSIPFTKIRVLNKKASIGSYCCIAFSTVPNENVDTDRYYVSFGVLAIGDNMIHDLVYGIPISSCTYVGDNWYEYEFSRPVYFAYYQENCPRGQVMAYIENNGGGGDDDEIGGNSSFLVGTWSVTSAQGWGGYTGDGEAEYLQFKSNGTYINVQFDDGLYITKGTWRATDTELVMKETEGDILGTYTYKILNHTQSTLTLKMWGITVNLTKVPDSTIDKYLN